MVVGLADAALRRSFAALVCDWDGTVVADRRVEARRQRRLLEWLCRLGVDVVVVSGTHVGNVDGQLRARSAGPGRLHLCVNRGSEVFRVEADGPRLLYRRRPSSAENVALDRAARLTVQALAAEGLDTRIVSTRLNRRKIDLIPEPAWSDPPKAAIADLLTATTARLQSHGIADLAAVVAVARQAAVQAGLADPRITSDAKHVEIGLTDKSDSMRWVLGYLASRAVGPGLMLIAGDEFGALGGVPGSDALLCTAGTERAVVLSVGAEPAGAPAGVVHRGGGPAMFLAVLEQLRTRLERDVPDVDEDPGWVLRLPAVEERERVDETLTSLADGRFGTRVGDDGSAVLCARVFTGRNAGQRLLEAPLWTLRPTPPPAPTTPEERVLDLRTGVLVRRGLAVAGWLRSLHFASAVRRGGMGLRAEAPSAFGEAPLRFPEDAIGQQGQAGTMAWARCAADPVGGVAAAAVQRQHRVGARHVLERRAAYLSDPRRAPSAAEAVARCAEASEVPFTAVLCEHRAAWGRRWADADIVIPDDPSLQLAVRFALHHLLASVAPRGEAAVGARGLSGPGYAGHVFWDADVFVLPALAAIHPSAARAMLAYRLHRLPAARAFAAATGRRGARFPWESARDGDDVTPRVGYLGGELMPVHSGDVEEHIVADVAWAAWHYATWAGDTAFLAGVGRPLLVETARYWASRARLDAAGRAHIDGVMGPDEYHAPVDDDAYTNVMARWNLRRAAELVVTAGGGEPGEVDQWLSLAGALVDGYDSGTGRYEQFAGYDQLESLTAASLGRPPVAADLLLSPAGVGRTQIVKQPDVLMLHHLVPGEVAVGSLQPNLDFYGPRTSHGSSLSPAIHAALLARAGRPDEALPWLRLAARLDLDDRTGTTATGLHVAALGGVWQALAFGFAGLRADGAVLRIDPHLPSVWSSMSLRLRFRGRRVVCDLRPGEVRVDADGPVQVAAGDAEPVTTSHAVLRC